MYQIMLLNILHVNYIANCGMWQKKFVDSLSSPG